MRKYKGVFFDMDGVVIDSSALWDHITETVKSEYDLDMSVLEESDGFNLSTEEAIRLVLESTGRFSESLFTEIIGRIDTLYESSLDSLASPCDGIEEVLTNLAGKDIMMVLVSNSSRRQVDMALSRFGLSSFFCGTVSSDDVSLGKPSPEPYLRAIEISGLDADRAIAVEDSHTGAKSAWAASLSCIILAPDGAPAAYPEIHRSFFGEYLDQITLSKNEKTAGH